MTQPQRVVPPVKRIQGYQRPMKGWYVHARPPYHRYLLRELTCLGVSYYAMLIVCALFRLRAGEEAWNAFLASLSSVPMMILNLLAFGLVLFHAISWFQVVPKTVPFIFVGGKRVPAHVLVAGGMASLAGATIALFGLFWWTLT